MEVIAVLGLISLACSALLVLGVVLQYMTVAVSGVFQFIRRLFTRPNFVTLHSMPVVSLTKQKAQDDDEIDWQEIEPEVRPREAGGREWS